MDINSQYRTLSENEREQWGSVPLLSSQMQEKDAIFGGVARLEKCLRFAIETYKPKCLMIANSCVAGVIGCGIGGTRGRGGIQCSYPYCGMLRLFGCGIL
jgi:nitrogenase molybdenum-iron protein alpha/beta subunit